MTREEAIKWLKTFKGNTGMTELSQAFDVAIAELSAEPCEDAISRQAVLAEAFEVDTKEYDRIDVVGVDAIEALPPVTPKQRTGWIPVKWHEITDEEREREDYPKDWVVFLDNVMPSDEEEILITTKYGSVEKDTAYYDNGNYLDSGYDWIDDVVAWMPLPKPYKESEESDV